MLQLSHLYSSTHQTNVSTNCFLLLMFNDLFTSNSIFPKNARLAIVILLSVSVLDLYLLSFALLNLNSRIYILLLRFFSFWRFILLLTFINCFQNALLNDEIFLYNQTKKRILWICERNVRCPFRCLLTRDNFHSTYFSVHNVISTVLLLSLNSV